jgi:putative glutamine amidotransferase
MSSGRPLVAVVGHHGESAGVGYEALETTYADALVSTAGLAPLLVPCVLAPGQIVEWIDRIDGILLTGDESNVEPWRYGAPASSGRGPYDPRRDALALALVVEARRRALPLLGICRGYEEINVAYGGTLWPAVHEAGFDDHREADDPDPRVRYRPAHPVRLTPGGFLHGLLGAEEWTVNSLHGQGIRDLGAGLTVEAMAPDGLVEAVRDGERGRWILGVQWHPEWESDRDPLSQAIFAAFGEASRRYAKRANPLRETPRNL